MYLQKIPEKKSGRTYLTIVRSVWKNGRSHKRTVKSLGYVDELEKVYPDPIAHFTKVVKEMSEKEKTAKTELTMTFAVGETMDFDANNRKNIGYMPFSHLYRELKIDAFFRNRQRSLNVDFKLDHIFRLLIFGRLVFPGSKKKTYERRETLFEKSAFSLDDVYRSLPLFHKYASDLKAFLHKRVRDLYGRKTDLVYYDVTNYYFEIDEPDDLRKKGVCKEFRPNPIVQMGLLMDQQGLPVTYELFSGNTNDCETLMPVLYDVRKQFDIGRFVVVADRGLNTSNNTGMALAKGDGYIYGQSILKATREMKAFCLNPEGYRRYGESESGFKVKSRLNPRTLRVENIHGKMVEVPVDEKQVFFYSEKYAKRARAQRQETLDKAAALIQSPARYFLASQYGAMKYVKGLDYDKKTGEILTTGKALILDEEKIGKEAQYDGYYAIVTSELDMPDAQVIEHYRGLWQIEESFRLTKSELEARPVYVSKKDHINAHFLTCFVALLFLRLIQLKTKHAYPAGQLLEALRRANGTRLQDGYFLFDYYSKPLECLGKAFNLRFDRRLLNKNDINKMKKSP